MKFKIDDIKENNDQSLYNALKSGGPEVFLGNMNKVETVKPERREGYIKVLEIEMLKEIFKVLFKDKKNFT